MVDAGGLVVEVLQTHNYVAPDSTDLDTWIDAYDITVTSMRDRAMVDAGTFATLGDRETTYIIDLSTMKIEWKHSGSTTGIGKPSAQLATEQMLLYLGAGG